MFLERPRRLTGVAKQRMPRFAALVVSSNLGSEQVIWMLIDYFQTPFASSGAVRRTVRERRRRGPGAAEATTEVLAGVVAEVATAVGGALVATALAAGAPAVAVVLDGLLVAAIAIPDP